MTKSELRIELAKTQNVVEEKAKAVRAASAELTAAQKKVKELKVALRAAEKAKE